MKQKLIAHMLIAVAVLALSRPRKSDHLPTGSHDSPPRRLAKFRHQLGRSRQPAVLPCRPDL